MAKRKRLEMPKDTIPAGLETKSAALPRIRMPIADVAGDTAGRAALEEVAGEMTRAEAEGRIVKKIALKDIDRHRLERDRRHFDAEEMEVLKTSIEARGQQTPIEVMDGPDGRYGLISGLRRLVALEALGETHALAFVRRPETAADAYVAMVEENEVRAGLSYYERAAVACQAADAGVFHDDGTAIGALFATATSAKRWKIMKFVTVYKLLGEVLRFPEALPEKFGLELIERIEADLAFYTRLKDRLRKTPSSDADAERALLERALREKGKATAPKPKPAKETLAPGLAVEARAGRVVLSGGAVDDAFLKALRAFVVSHAKTRALSN